MTSPHCCGPPRDEVALGQSKLSLQRMSPWFSQALVSRLSSRRRRHSPLWL